MADDDKFVLIQGKEHVRLRPSMYFGDTGQRGLHELVWGILAYGIDKVIEGYCDIIHLIMQADDHIIMHFSGFQISMELHPKYNRSVLDRELNELDRSSGLGYEHYGGITRLNLAAINAVCRIFEVEVHQTGSTWQTRYEQGNCSLPLQQIAAMEPDKKPSLTISFTPDYGIFQQVPFNFALIRYRLRELSFLANQATYILTDTRQQPTTIEQFEHENGLLAFITHLNRDFRPVHEPLIIEKTFTTVDTYRGIPKTMYVAIALQYVAEDHPIYIANYINLEGCWGRCVHVQSFLQTMRASLNMPAEDPLKPEMIWKEPLQRDTNLYQRGLVAVVAVRHPEPQYKSATNGNLINTDIRGAVRVATRELLQKHSTAVGAIRQHIQSIIDQRIKRLTG